MAELTIKNIMEDKVVKLKEEGCASVYTWNGESNEEDSDHVHPFDTHLVILEGDIEIRMDGKSVILKADNEIDTPRGRVHYSKAGIGGCKYIVAEKHY